ncbi:geranylgeranyl transferase type-2 subunit alpha 1 [Fagus crenata]
MHGQPRKAPKPEDEAASLAKAEKLRALQSQFLSYHHNNVYTKEALEVNAKLLEINPEYYTAWNYRKLSVEHRLSQSESDLDSVKSILSEELKVVESALKQNFKSYGAWQHRKWVLSKGQSSVDHELRLLDRFQKADPRNFHAWNYRRFVAALMNRSEVDELQYTTDMINNNFSNYSAWHNRSVLLSNLLKRKVQGFSPKEEVLNEEYELVHQALFTDPDDQSGWFYHLWLLDQTVKADAPLLVSSWPAHDSNLILSGDRCLDDDALSPFNIFHSELGTIPLIIYFNQAVEGVNSSTISVESVLNTKGELTWKPLSTNNSQTAQVWVTYLDYPDIKLHSSEFYPVEVSVGHSQGIISSSGFHYSHPSRFAFKVFVQPLDKDAARHGVEMVSWREENFLLYESHSQESNPNFSLDQLNIKDDQEESSSKWRAETIANEIALFRELLSEINCKIGKLTLARLLMAHDTMLSPFANKMVHSEEVIELYSDLMKLDSPHSQYYKDECSLVLLQQITSSRESLLRYCFCHRDGTSSFIGNSICLRLNNLSLLRMGSIEKLLWVQMLDLSHNELRSIEGLEAMQLLSRLNLSNNKISSFTALGPLRLLKSLKVLDISCNEIGSHSIDTTRYICSSPLSHTEEIDWSRDEIVTGDVNLTNYWEAFLIFKGLNLTQLDIVGNAITDEKFKSFLVKIVPTLKWLDGGELH